MDDLFDRLKQHITYDDDSGDTKLTLHNSSTTGIMIAHGKKAYQWKRVISKLGMTVNEARETTVNAAWINELNEWVYMDKKNNQT